MQTGKTLHALTLFFSEIVEEIYMVHNSPISVLLKFFQACEY